MLIVTGTSICHFSKGELVPGAVFSPDSCARLAHRLTLLLYVGVPSRFLIMKEIKLSGRERAVLRAIDFAVGTSGEDILIRTRIEEQDLVDVLNGLIDTGYAEVVPYAESITIEGFQSVMFEVNPSYALQLREALLKR